MFPITPNKISNSIISEVQHLVNQTKLLKHFKLTFRHDTLIAE